MFMFKTKDFVRFDLPDSSYCVSLAGWERGREFAERRKPRERGIIKGKARDYVIQKSN